MSNIPLSNDERHVRNHPWYERMQQQQQHPPFNRPRVVLEETLHDDTSRIIQRPTTSFPPEHRRRGQGRGRPHQEHAQLPQPIGDYIETDADVDDTLSEFAGGWYSPRRQRNRSSTMRPTTWKKLNQWLDAHQQVGNENMEKVQSMAELRFAEYMTSEEEENNEQHTADAPEKEQQKDMKPDSDETNKERTDTQPEVAPAEAEVPPPKRKSIVVVYHLLKNLMLLLLYIIETLSPVTFPLLIFLKNHMKTGIMYLWARFFQPIMMQGAQAREDPLSMVIMLLVLPVVALLGVAYCFVCLFYWLHRLFLVEP
ncbi:uncharacterized protein LOC125774717 [Anopheles funestus]|uniref:uncharacterized protein LOC125774717 n=1 Tax=Anopheles funestus TaxID=62324 RepID=UPI0020C5E22A|nr:uncharacterized protein LOC125774717 [Anopheles funestus]